MQISEEAVAGIMIGLAFIFIIFFAVNISKDQSHVEAFKGEKATIKTNDPSIQYNRTDNFEQRRSNPTSQFSTQNDSSKSNKS